MLQSDEQRRARKGRGERGGTRTKVRELHIHGEKSVTVFVKTRNSGTSLLISDDPSPFATRCELHSFSTYLTPLNPHPLNICLWSNSSLPHAKAN